MSTSARSNRVRRRLVALGVGALLVASCGGSSTSTPRTTAAAETGTTSGTTTEPAATSTTAKPTKSILQLARSEGSLSTLLGLLDKAGLTAFMKGAGPFSLIAPSDAAFTSMDKAVFDKISGDTLLLKSVLQYHIVAKRISAKDIASGSVPTVEGSALTLKAAGKLPTVNGFNITRAARATNGTIFVVESVLIPPDVKIS